MIGVGSAGYPVTVMAATMSAVIAIICAVATVINVVYYLKYRKRSVFAVMRLANAFVTGYSVYAHAALLLRGDTAHVALFISVFLLSMQMLVWSLVNLLYLRNYGGDGIIR